MQIRNEESELRRNVVGVRWSDRELNLVAVAAHDKWTSVSALVREIVMERLAPDGIEAVTGHGTRGEGK